VRPHVSPTAHAALLAAARTLPFYEAPAGETPEELAREVERTPAQAGVHIASDM
jgi:hypothetical protein